MTLDDYLISRARRYAVVRGGVVENIILAEAGFALPDVELIPAEEAPDAAIGAAWDGQRFVRPEPPAPEPEAPRGPTIEARIAALEAEVTAVKAAR
jgi:hypothetical protein